MVRWLMIREKLSIAQELLAIFKPACRRLLASLTAPFLPR